jgi:pimeloyl-ACP methyl ester carboxylesterase
MIEHAERLAFDFTAALAEENPTMAAVSLRVPTLLFSGGHSPYLTQRIVQRMAAVIEGAEVRHLPDAGHMLAMTHAAAINPRSPGISPAACPCLPENPWRPTNDGAGDPPRAG